jgi:acyl-CoA synthetase (AMP-forming)/AMP-acid ligase II
MQMTLGSSFARSARKFPQKLAIKDDVRSLSYRALNERVNRLANALMCRGWKKGSHAATLSSNSTYLMEVYLAHLKLGVVTVPLTVRETKEEILRQVRLSDSRFLLFHSDLSDVAGLVVESEPSIEDAICFGGPAPEFALNMESLIDEGGASEPDVEVVEDDPAFIMFTGGTTGEPKGAILTHKSLLWNIICVTTENQSPTPQDRIYYPMQLYHTAALSRFLAHMYAGATFIGSPTFDPDRYLSMVEQERTTFIVGNTTIWKMLLEIQRTRHYDTSSIKGWLHSQGALEPELDEEVRNVLFPNARRYVSYALTEASPAVTILKPEDNPCHWSSVGRPYMCTEVRIADPDTDEVLPDGEVGEIQVLGPTVMKGYYNNPQETERTLRGGWLHTGDLGRYDERGYLYVVDRLKDMIKSGGINIYSREIEEVLNAHPLVDEAAVIGVPHEKWGESVRAIVVPKKGSSLTEEMILEHCRSHLAGHKKPTSVVFVEELPKGTFGGKILKRILREKYGKP